MRTASRCLAGLLALTTLGCKDAEDAPMDSDGAVARTCDGGETRSAVVRSIQFVRATGGVSDGFDLDGAVTAPGDAAGCGVADMTSPDGMPGIDNSFANLLPVLDLTEASAAEEIIALAIQTGDVLLMVQVSGIDDPGNDDCVSVEILQGEGVPILRADGLLAEGQTLGVDPDGVRTVVEGTITDGVLEARGADLSLPLQILNAVFEVSIVDAAVRLTMADDGSMDGVLGGGVDVEALLASLNAQGVNDQVVQLVGPVLETAKDLAPDDQGNCTRMSTNIAVEGVEAFVLE